MCSSLSCRRVCLSGRGKEASDCRHQDQLREILAKIFGFFYCFEKDFVANTKSSKVNFLLFFLLLLSKVKINDTNLVRKRLCVTVEREKMSTVNSFERVWKCFHLFAKYESRKAYDNRTPIRYVGVTFPFVSITFDSWQPPVDRSHTHESNIAQPTRSRPSETRRDNQHQGGEIVITNVKTMRKGKCKQVRDTSRCKYLPKLLNITLKQNNLRAPQFLNGSSSPENIFHVS